MSCACIWTPLSLVPLWLHAPCDRGREGGREGRRECVTDWLTGWLTDSLTNSLSNSLTDSLTDWMAGGWVTGLAFLCTVSLINFISRWVMWAAWNCARLASHPSQFAFGKPHQLRIIVRTTRDGQSSDCVAQSLDLCMCVHTYYWEKGKRLLKYAVTTPHEWLHVACQNYE